MADQFNKQYVKDVIDLAVDEIDAMLKYYVDTAEGLPWGGKRADDWDMRSVWNKMTAQYPPQPLILQTGESVFESPWVMALQMSENGNEWLRKFKKMFKAEEV